MRGLLLSVVCCGIFANQSDAKPTTFDGRYEIGTIDLTVVYLVPKDRKPLPDWRERVDYHITRIAKFHERELNGQSTLKATIHPVPLVSENDTAFFRKGDQNYTFFSIMKDVKSLLKWQPVRTTGFPVLLVLSDFNWRELDDFTRTRIVDGKEIHEGNISREGRHFPGAESGGARATYINDPGYGMGLVSADGWRVPYGGSDCVVYHEGLGHSIGLPHPQPIDNTVMGTAQYEFPINRAKLNREQNLVLGWKPPEKEPDRSTDLFTHFTAITEKPIPKVGEEVILNLTWPQKAELKKMTVKIQTELFGPWVTLPTTNLAPLPSKISLGQLDRPTPVSYRVSATLADGQKGEFWGYFQVKPVGKK